MENSKQTTVLPISCVSRSRPTTSNMQESSTARTFNNIDNHKHSILSIEEKNSKSSIKNRPEMSKSVVMPTSGTPSWRRSNFQPTVSRQQIPQLVSKEKQATLQRLQSHPTPMLKRYFMRNGMLTTSENAQLAINPHQPHVSSSQADHTKSTAASRSLKNASSPHSKPTTSANVTSTSNNHQATNSVSKRHTRTSDYRQSSKRSMCNSSQPTINSKGNMSSAEHGRKDFRMNLRSRSNLNTQLMHRRNLNTELEGSATIEIMLAKSDERTDSILKECKKEIVDNDEVMDTQSQQRSNQIGPKMPRNIYLNSFDQKNSLIKLNLNLREKDGKRFEIVNGISLTQNRSVTNSIGTVIDDQAIQTLEEGNEVRNVSTVATKTFNNDIEMVEAANISEIIGKESNNEKPAHSAKTIFQSASKAAQIIEPTNEIVKLSQNVSSVLSSSDIPTISAKSISNDNDDIEFLQEVTVTATHVVVEVEQHFPSVNGETIIKIVEVRLPITSIFLKDSGKNTEVQCAVAGSSSNQTSNERNGATHNSRTIQYIIDKIPSTYTPTSTSDKEGSNNAVQIIASSGHYSSDTYFSPCYGGQENTEASALALPNVIDTQANERARWLRSLSHSASSDTGVSDLSLQSSIIPFDEGTEVDDMPSSEMEGTEDLTTPGDSVVMSYPCDESQIDTVPESSDLRENRDQSEALPAPITTEICQNSNDSHGPRRMRNLHRQRINPDACKHCEKEFTTKILLSVHQKVCAANAALKFQKCQRYKCDVCTKLYKKRGCLMLHFRTHSTVYSVCSTCKVKFHQTLHYHSIKLHNFCVKCRKIYIQVSRMYPGYTPSLPRVVRYHCRICQTQHDSMADLQNHQCDHIKVAYMCSTCDKLYKESNSFVNHMKRHTTVS